ncbi:MAG: PAS domain S-box protein [Leptospiraceae bacterium]|nr:PAS domain S-box protein [Leptospiraceae bacterium]MCP5498176.1 PAS domain S-box protein [Leptospiraceae bacterium]
METIEQNTKIFEILIAEDDPNNLRLITRYLRSEFYKLTTVMSGELAIEEAQKNSFDLILLDVVMPGITGFVVCQKLKKFPKTADTPVIFTTSLDDIFNIEKAFESGAVDIVHKPIQKEELQARVKVHLDLKRAKENLKQEVINLKKTKQELIKSESRLQAIVESAVDAIVTVDRNGIILTFNQSACRIFEYSLGEIVGQNVKVLMPEPFRSKHDQFIQNYQETGEKKIIGIGREVIAIKKDGTIFPMHLSVSEVRLEDETIYTGIIRDLSDVKTRDEKIEKQYKSISEANMQLYQTFEKLTESNNNMEAIFNASADAFIVSDLDGNIVRVNNKAIELFGYVKSDLNHFKLYQFIAEGYIQSFQTFIKDVQMQVNIQIEVVCRRKDNSKFEAEVNGTIFEFNQQKHILSIIRDISKQKRWEQALKESEERYRTLYEETPAMLHSIDQEDKLVSVSKHWLKVLGYEKEEVLGKHSTDFLTPESREYALKIAMPIFFRVGEIKDVPYQFVKKNGKTIDVLLSVIAQKNDDEKAIRSFAYMEDVTERNKMIRELGKAKELADSANKAKSEFLANMSHEIRTPLNAVLGFSEILEAEISNKIHKQYLSTISLSGKALLNLINDILDLSKIEAGKMELSFQPISISELFQDMKNIFSHKIIEKGLKFIIQIEKAIPDNLVLDEVRIRQILLNLIGNALKFTNKGFIKLAAYTKAIPNKTDMVELFLVIEDTGIGIAEEQKTTIFQAFKQVSGQNHAKYGGTGLGLTICNKLVKMMKGTIILQSTIGEGSKFIVVLSSVKIDTNQVIRNDGIEIDLENINFQSKTLLVVDDITTNRELIKTYLFEFFEIKIIEAKDGLEAVEQAKKYKPDLVLMDLIMPVMDGFEAVDMIKTDNTIANIPILAFTSSAMKQTKDLVDKKFDGYLTKPISRNELIRELIKFFPYDIKNQITQNEKQNDLHQYSTIKLESFQELYKILGELIGDWNEIVDILEIDKIQNFTNRLKSIGQNYSFYPLIEYSNTLEEHLNSFNIEEIQDTIKKYPDIISKIKALISKEGKLTNPNTQ